jgi:hypothetical protein
MCPATQSTSLRQLFQVISTLGRGVGVADTFFVNPIGPFSASCLITWTFPFGMQIAQYV